MNLEFKELVPGDVKDIQLLYANSKSRAYLGGVVIGESFKNKFKTLLSNTNAHWCVFCEDQFIGLVSLALHHNEINYEVSYQLLPDFWGQGWGKGCIEFLLSEASKRKLNYVVAETQLNNKRSVKLLEYMRFQFIESFERFGATQSLYRRKIEDSEMNSE